MKVLLIYFLSTLSRIPKHCIFVNILLTEDYIQGALQKELLIATFVELFETITLGKPY